MQSDFTRGTYRITVPGTYVLGEDIVFDPVDTPQAHPELYGHPAYSMGFFAALTVECDNVVIDLDGHVLQQAYTHYFAQRFFSIIELANAPFVPLQGPGTLNTDHALVSAAHCRIANGTLGLSSHSAVHGNNNAHVVLAQLRIEQFEVTGVQLNGVHGAHLEDVRLQSIAHAPLGDMVFTFLRHARLLETAEPPDHPDPSIDFINTEDVREASQYARALLLKPFRDAQLEDPRQRDVPRQLARIRDRLAAAAADPAHAARRGVPLHLDRFVNTAGFPDGSALYGVLVNSSGVAVKELAAVCPKTSASAGEDNPAAHPWCRRSRRVSLLRVEIHDMVLHAVETIGIKADNDIIKDRTGALVKVDHLLHCPRWVLSQLRLLHNAALRERPGLADALRRGGAAARAFLAGPGIVTLGNADIMAHVAKGIMGIRVEDTDGIAIRDVRVRRVRNPSGAGAAILPDESLTAPAALDDGMARRFNGPDIRVVFVAHCTRLAVTRLDIQDIDTTHGVARMIEMHRTTHGHLDEIVMNTVRAITSAGVHLQPSCAHISLGSIVYRGAATAAPPPALLADLRALMAGENEMDDNAAQAFLRRWWWAAEPLALSVEGPAELAGATVV